MTYDVTGKSAGDRLYGPHQSRYVTVREDQLSHPAHDPGFVVKGDPVLVNGHALIGVALVDGVSTATLITIDTEGIFALTVHGTDDVGDSAVALGDALFINRSNCQINKVADPATNTPFGYALGTVTGGASALIGVKVHWSPSGDINPALAERDFTTWAITGIYDTGVALSSSDIIAIRNNGNVFWHDQGAYTAYIVSSAGALLATLSSHLGISGFSRLASLLDRYMVIPKWNDADNAVTKLCVQEGITELWEREVDSDKGAHTLAGAPGPVDVSLIAISPSGEWLAAIIEDDGGNGLIFIYQGS